MLRKFLLLASLVCLAKCGINNIPSYDPTEKVIDCTDGNTVADTCDVMLVVESLVIMTYFNISKNFHHIDLPLIQVETSDILEIEA